MLPLHHSIRLPTTATQNVVTGRKLSNTYVRFKHLCTKRLGALLRLSLHAPAPLLALSILAPAAAHGDSFLYTFNSPVYGDSFVYDSPTLLSADTNFTTPFCSYSGGACNITQINPTSGTIVVGDEVGGNGGYDSYQHVPASNFTPGTYVVPDGAGATFTVEDVASFLYTFNSPVYEDSFVYDSPTLLSADTNFTTPFCSYSGGGCNIIQINPISGTIVVGDEVGGNGGYDSYQHVPASNFTPGTYVVPDGAGATFTVDAVPVAAPVPEPSSLVLLGSGLLGTVGALRRRLRRD